MKTHDLARALNQLAKMLRAGPNVELGRLDSLTSDRQQKTAPTSADPVALSAFVAFSKFTKQQWADVIQAYNLPIEVLPSYSARDLMGKIMSYFSENPDARRRLTESVERQSSQASPELMRALSTLLKG